MVIINIHTKNVLKLITVICIIISFSCSKAKEDKRQWISIFNGKNLDGWQVKIKGFPVGYNYKNTFKVDKGILSVDYTEYKDTFNNTFGHIFYKEPFSNYRLKLDYRFLDKQVGDGEAWAYKNSGVMIHSEDPNKISLDQGFPVSIEIQLLGGNGTEDRPTANLCTPGTHVKIDDTLVTEHCISSTSKTFHDDQWVRLEVEVYNDSLIRHFINGDKVMEYTSPVFGGEYSSESSLLKEGKATESGYISLQSESHPIQFKNIEIQKLD